MGQRKSGQRKSQPPTTKEKATARRNRSVGLDEALGGTLDPVFKKRGFASRDLVAHWPAMAPPPYDREAMPDKLTWARGKAGEEGATLYLSCAPAHALALAHEADRIRDAINRYFGYVLVGRVKLSATPFSPGSAGRKHIAPRPSAQQTKTVDMTLENVNDDNLREALRKLGLGLLTRKENR